MLKQLPLAAIAVGAALLGHDQTAASSAVASDCRKVVVTDATSGQPLKGIEDIAINVAANIAYLSADDRWTVEERAARGESALPQGGIYMLPLDDSLLRFERIAVADATAQFKTRNSLHPHGIGLILEPQGKATLYVINRRYERRHAEQRSRQEPGAQAGRWVQSPTVEVFDVHETGALGHRHTVHDQAFCRANGIVGLTSSRFLVSNDSGACATWERRIEQAFGRKRGNVVLVDLDETPGEAGIRRIAEGIGFANGLARDAQHLYVAATRERSVLAYRIDRLDDADTLGEPARVFPTGGGPDNLSWVSDHLLLMAVHPSLLRLAAYRYRWMPWVDSAPTRIVMIDVRDGVRHTIYENSAGKPLSAATVAAVHENILIAGSVTDAGLMLCRLTNFGG